MEAKQKDYTTFLRKFMQAKKMEKEAFMTLMPENVRKHLSVIEKEVKELFFECLAGAVTPEPSEKSTEQTRVKKVDIG